MLPGKLDSPQFDLQASAIHGCFEILVKSPCDARGSFTKVMQSSAFAAIGLQSHFSECFVTRSRHGSLRGMHLQLPPADGAKLVSCLAGSMLDVALDLRPSSPTFGVVASFSLDANRSSAVYIPSGVAHGFCAPAEEALVLYLVSSEYAPESDTGVAWNSFGFNWPISDPILSQRDQALPTFKHYCDLHPTANG